MVNSHTAGVIFTVNPVTENHDEILIESSYGLGEAVVSGSVTPDEFIVDKESLELKEKKIGKKEFYITRDENGNNVNVDIPDDKKESQSLQNFEIKKLAEIATSIEKHYEKPQDIEFAIEKGRIYITQSRPITTLGNKKEAADLKEAQEKETPEVKSEEQIEIKDANLLASGISASPGVGRGKVVLVHDINELSKIKKGDVLVARMTSPDYVSAMERASAIVTDAGGNTCHAAIVSREMGIPCVVGTEVGTSKLKEGTLITVDANKGKVYEGDVYIHEEKKVEIQKDLKTKIKIKAIMDLPDYAEKTAKTGADGVGLLRGEFINLNSKEHPIAMIESGREEEFVANLTKNLKKVCEAFKGKPVWYRTLDAPTDEFKNLKGGENEPEEDNPMMGWRSIRRSLDQPELLRAEYKAVKAAHEEYPELGIMIPLVTDVEQVRKAKEIFKETTGLEPTKDIEFGIMIETPASVYMIRELCEEGISFASIGTNDLTQFTLACDRNSEKVAKLYNPMHPAVLRSITKVLRICKKMKVKTSICGQAGSDPEMAKILFEEGIDSIAANADAVQTIKQLIYDLENP